MMRSISGTMTVFLAVSLVGRMVAAEGKDPRELEAKKACNANRPDAGIEILAALYAETSKPMYIHNQARCYQKNGRDREALLKFRDYLQLAPSISASEKKEVQDIIAELERRLSQPTAQPVPAPPPVVPSQPGGGPEAQPQPQPQPVPPPMPGPLPPPAPQADSGGGLRMAGLIVGGAGVVSIVVAAIFGSKAKDAANELETKATPGSVYDQSLKDIDSRGRSAQTKEFIFFGVGGAALIGGGVLYFLGARQQGPEGGPPGSVAAVTVLPAVSSRDLGAALRVTF